MIKSISMYFTGPLVKSGIGGIATLEPQLPIPPETGGNDVTETEQVHHKEEFTDKNMLTSLLLFNMEAGDKKLYSRAANYKPGVRMTLQLR